MFSWYQNVTKTITLEGFTISCYPLLVVEWTQSDLGYIHRVELMFILLDLAATVNKCFAVKQ